MTSAPDQLAEIGRALYGDEWQGRMAAALGINRQTIRRWLNGDTPFDWAHSAWADIRQVIQAEAQAARNRAACLEAMARPCPTRA